MISILALKDVHDWCYLYWYDFVQIRGNQVTMFHLILNKVSKYAILTKNDDVIDLKFWNQVLT